MCFLDGVYLQFLEGEAAWWMRCIRKLKKIRVIATSRCWFTSRLHSVNTPKWSMALLTWNDEIKKLFSRFNPDSECDLYTADPATVAALLRQWVSTNN